MERCVFIQSIRDAQRHRLAFAKPKHRPRHGAVYRDRRTVAPTKTKGCACNDQIGDAIPADAQLPASTRDALSISRSESAECLQQSKGGGGLNEAAARATV